MAKERKAWQIMQRLKHGDGKWYSEKFMTGGKTYYSFSEAQYIKNTLKAMASSFNYKVVRIQ